MAGWNETRWNPASDLRYLPDTIATWYNNQQSITNVQLSWVAPLKGSRTSFCHVPCSAQEFNWRILVIRYVRKLVRLDWLFCILISVLFAYWNKLRCVAGVWTFIPKTYSWCNTVAVEETQFNNRSRKTYLYIIKKILKIICLDLLSTDLNIAKAIVKWICISHFIS